jgi:ABC-type sugar transport system permease subunit
MEWFWNAFWATIGYGVASLIPLLVVIAVAAAIVTYQAFRRSRL